jgi:hypothetical protein
MKGKGMPFKGKGMKGKGKKVEEALALLPGIFAAPREVIRALDADRTERLIALSRQR